MACISKLASAIAYDCDTGATGLVSALIINKADIASFTYDGDLVSVINLKPGAKPYKIDTVKRSLVLSSSLKVNDGAPNAYTHSATIVDTSDRGYGAALRSRINSYANASFVIVTWPVGKSFGPVYGLYYGMSPTSVDFSSHDNGGWTTITVSTPENVIGEDALFMSRSAYDLLYATAVG